MCGINAHLICFDATADGLAGGGWLLPGKRRLGAESGAWAQRGVPTALSPVPPPPSKVSRADHQISCVPVWLLVSLLPCYGALGDHQRS